MCWHALFSQLEIQQREFTFKLLSDAKCEIPIIITDKEDTYLFTSHFAGIHGYFYDPSLKFKFKGYQNLDHHENILSALRDVLNLLESKQFKVISKLDVLANCLNQNYTSTQLHQVFGYNQLSLDTLREITKLSIRQSPASFPKPIKCSIFIKQHTQCVKGSISMNMIGHAYLNYEKIDLAPFKAFIQA